MYLMGFIIWAALGIITGFIMHTVYRGPETSRGMTMVFGFFGAFIGGMLSMSGYLYHDPAPLRIGGLIGAFSGAAAFTFMYHFIAKKAL